MEIIFCCYWLLYELLVQDCWWFVVDVSILALLSLCPCPPNLKQTRLCNIYRVLRSGMICRKDGGRSVNTMPNSYPLREFNRPIPTWRTSVNNVEVTGLLSFASEGRIWILFDDMHIAMFLPYIFASQNIAREPWKYGFMSVTTGGKQGQRRWWKPSLMMVLLEECETKR